MATKTDLLIAMQPHLGRAHGINAAQLTDRLGIPERALRDLIHAARTDGHPICGKPESGYFLAANAEELNETCNFLSARALGTLQMVARLKKVPLADLIGQARLAL